MDPAPRPARTAADRRMSTVSFYVFGEEESSLEQAAEENGGLLDPEHIKQHFGDTVPPVTVRVAWQP